MYWCTWRRLKRNSRRTKVCQRHAFLFRAESTQANDYIPRSVDPMFRRRHRNNNIARLPLDELDRSCGRTTGFPCSCLNAQMIGRIAVASRHPASLPPPVGRFVALTMARWALWAFWARRVSLSLAKSDTACYVHLLHRYFSRKMIFFKIFFTPNSRGYHSFLKSILVNFMRYKISLS